MTHREYSKKYDLQMQLGIKPNGFKFLQDVLFVSEAQLIALMYKRINFTGDPITINGVTYPTFRAYEQTKSFCPRNELILSMIDMDLQNYHMVHEYLAVRRKNGLTIGTEAFYNTEAVKRWNLQADIIRELQAHTGINTTEIIYLYARYREGVEEYYYKHLGVRPQYVLEPMPTTQPIQPTNNVVVNHNHTSIGNGTRTQQQSRHNTSSQSNQQTQVTPLTTTKTVDYKGALYPSLDSLVLNLNLDSTLLSLDLQRNMSVEQAVDKQVLNRGTRKTKQGVTINNINYNSQREVCNVFGLNETEVAFYKSANSLSTYEALLYHINKKYGAGYFH